MFVTCVLEILDLLSLCVKLYHHKSFFFGLSTIVIRVWPKLLIEKIKSENYYKFINMNSIIFQNFLVLTFENCSKDCNCLNPLFVKQIKKWLFEALLKTLKKKTRSFCVHEQRNHKCYYVKTFSFTTHLEYWNFKFYMTWVIFWYKIWIEKFLSPMLS